MRGIFCFFYFLIVGLAINDRVWNNEKYLIPGKLLYSFLYLIVAILSYMIFMAIW